MLIHEYRLSVKTLWTLQKTELPFQNEREGKKTNEEAGLEVRQVRQPQAPTDRYSQLQ